VQILNKNKHQRKNYTNNCKDESLSKNGGLWHKHPERRDDKKE
jgi:hypothetical protein